MIEITVRDYLIKKLSVPVLFEKPTGAEEYVLIERTGGNRNDYINRATFAVQSYSDTMQNAARLNEEVKDALIGNGFTTHGIIESEDISKCELISDYNFTDTTTKEYRYQAVYNIVY